MNKLLLETGDALLKEDGGFLLLESIGNMTMRQMGYVQAAMRSLRTILFFLLGVS